jgi:hypothetical protein
MKFDNLKDYSSEQFRRITGVKRATFQQMLEILSQKQKLKYVNGGRPSKLSLENMLLATLEYLREYRTYANIAATYGVHESSIYRIIKWVENVLINNGTFSLPGKKALLKPDTCYEVVLIDATEAAIERPKKTAKLLLRQEKTTHNKVQVVVDKSSKHIICTSFSNGKCHDFLVFKDSKVHNRQWL